MNSGSMLSANDPRAGNSYSTSGEVQDSRGCQVVGAGFTEEGLFIWTPKDEFVQSHENGG